MEEDPLGGGGLWMNPSNSRLNGLLLLPNGSRRRPRHYPLSWRWAASAKVMVTGVEEEEEEEVEEEEEEEEVEVEVVEVVRGYGPPPLPSGVRTSGMYMTIWGCIPPSGVRTMPSMGAKLLRLAFRTDLR